MAGDDVVVVGAGVAGLAAARGLAEAGASVRVVERDAPGAGATRVAAGVMTPGDVHEWHGELGVLHRRALAAWPGFAASLEEAVGSAFGWRSCGSLRVAVTGEDDDVAWLAATASAASAMDVEVDHLDSPACQDLVPGLAPVVAGLWMPEDGAVDTEALVAAQLRAAERAGVVVERDEVVALRRTGSRVTGVGLARGGARDADAVVVTTGAEVARADWLPPDDRPALEPVAGEAVLAGPATGGAADLTPTVVRTRRGPIVPRDGGRLWLGTSVRRDGFVARPRVGEVARLLARAVALLPAAASLDVLDVRVGLRPVAVDGRPHVGPAATDGLVYAVGHGREGILHAPLVAEVVTATVTTGRLPAWAEPARPRVGRPPVADGPPGRSAAGGSR